MTGACTNCKKLREQYAEEHFRVMDLKEQVIYLKADLSVAIEALSRANQVLTVPAAEYVPAVTDAWKIIDAALCKIHREKEKT